MQHVSRSCAPPSHWALLVHMHQRRLPAFYPQSPARSSKPQPSLLRTSPPHPLQTSGPWAASCSSCAPAARCSVRRLAVRPPPRPWLRCDSRFWTSASRHSCQTAIPLTWPRSWPLCCALSLLSAPALRSCWPPRLWRLAWRPCPQRCMHNLLKQHSGRAARRSAASQPAAAQLAAPCSSERSVPRSSMLACRRPPTQMAAPACATAWRQASSPGVAAPCGAAAAQRAGAAHRPAAATAAPVPAATAQHILLVRSALQAWTWRVAARLPRLAAAAAAAAHGRVQRRAPKPPSAGRACSAAAVCQPSLLVALHEFRVQHSKQDGGPHQTACTCCATLMPTHIHTASDAALCSPACLELSKCSELDACCESCCSRSNSHSLQRRIVTVSLLLWSPLLLCTQHFIAMLEVEGTCFHSSFPPSALVAAALFHA